MAFAEGSPISPMMMRFRRLTVVAFILAICGLCGCGSINSNITPGIVDAIPPWAGGLPADAPPRPGTAKYDEFMRERERQRLLPAVKADPSSTPQPALDAVH